jgi:hypothetical protein
VHVNGCGEPRHASQTYARAHVQASRLPSSLETQQIQNGLGLGFHRISHLLFECPQTCR